MIPFKVHFMKAQWFIIMWACSEIIHVLIFLRLGLVTGKFLPLTFSLDKLGGCESLALVISSTHHSPYPQSVNSQGTPLKAPPPLPVYLL